MREALSFTLSVWILCLAGKVPVFGQRDLSITPAFITAIFWQDALLAVLVFPLFLGLCRKRWMPWVAYPVLVVYLAINSILLLVLSSPLTLSLMRATGGALQDSIMMYVTPANCMIIWTLSTLGSALPFIIRRLPSPWIAALATVASSCIIAGPFGNSHCHTDGLDRNAIITFARSLFPRVTARRMHRDWRASGFPQDAAKTDLSGFISAARNRNVVLISLESTGAQYLAPWGASNNPMPNLSRLAESGILFENAYAVYPESIKGLLSTLCSIYPAIDTPAESLAQASSPSLADAFALAGYTNALFHSGRFMYLGMDAVVRNRGFHLLCDAGGISGNFNSSFGVDEPATIDKMLHWIDTLSASQRFFLCYLPIAGHHPYDTPERGPWPGTTEQERYLNALWFGDRVLGRFLDQLHQRHLDTNTLFVIYGDHSEAFGQHPGNYGHTLNIYDENVRVPLLIALPGLIEKQVRVPGVASLVDVTPTVVDLVGLQQSPHYQGTSLLREQGSMALFFTDYSLGLLGLRDGERKYIYEIESGRSKIFDLAVDPGERNNVAARQPGRVIAYRQHLLDWARGQRYRAAAGRRRGARERLAPDQTRWTYRKSNPLPGRHIAVDIGPGKS